MAQDSPESSTEELRRTLLFDTIPRFWPVAIVILSFLASFHHLSYSTAIILGGLIIYGVKNRTPKQIKRTYSVSMFDGLIALFVLIELFAYTRSTLMLNSNAYLLLVFYGLITYYFVRKTMSERKLQLGLLWGLCLIGLYWILIMMKKAVWMSDQISDRGFTDLSLFKDVYSPLVTGNEWTLFLILFIPIPLILFLLSKSHYTRIIAFTVFTLTGYCLVIEFSRGGYIGLLLFIVFSLAGIWWYERNLAKGLIGGLAVAFLLIGASTISHRATISTTVQMNKTVSQKRSSNARLQMWEVAITSLKTYPFFGVGAYNYQLASNVMRQRSLDETPLRRVSSVLTQLVTEKGIVGLLLPTSMVLLLIFSGLYALHFAKKIDEQRSVIIIVLLAGLIGVIVRDMTMSTLLFRNFTFSMFCILCALLFTLCNTRGKVWQIKLSHVIALMIPAMILGAFVLLHRLRSEYVARENKLTHRALRSGAFDTAIAHSDNILRIYPNYPTPFMHKAMALAQCASDENIISWSNIFLCSGDIDPAIAQLKEAQRIEPRDETIEFGIGWLFAAKGEWWTSLKHLDKAYKIDPTMSVYPLLMGIVYENMRRESLAIGYYAKAVALDPDICLSRFYDDLIDRIPDAEDRIFNDAAVSLRSSDEPISTARLGALHFFAANYDEASELLISARADLPGMNRPYYYLGAIALTMGDTTAALGQWRKSNILDRKDRLVNFEYGQLAHSMGIPTGNNLLRTAAKTGQAEPMYSKRRFFYRALRPYTNTILTKEFMNYISPDIDILEIEGLLK